MTDQEDTAPLRVRPELAERELTGQIIGSFYDAYNGLDVGYLESIYAGALAIALRDRGLRVDREFPIRVEFRGRTVGLHRLDMVVERRVVIEIKSSEFLSPLARRQLKSYLTAARLEVGLLLHFGPNPEFIRIVSPGFRNPVVSG